MASKKIVPQSWHIQVDKYWDSTTIKGRKNKFNRNAKNNTPFQRALMESECCMNGRIVVGSRTLQQHWNKGGDEAKHHLMDYAATALKIENPYEYDYDNMEQPKAPKKMPAFVREYFTLAIEKARIEMKLEAVRKKYQEKKRPKV